MTHRPLPDERPSITHRFTVGKLKVYVIVGLYEDGQPGEVFLTCHKKGTLERGLLNTVGVLISTLLQHGVPVTKVAEKLTLMSFDPAGVTSNQQIPMASSVCDYLGKWLLLRFGGNDDQ